MFLRQDTNFYNFFLLKSSTSTIQTFLTLWSHIQLTAYMIILLNEHGKQNPSLIFSLLLTASQIIMLDLRGPLESASVFMVITSLVYLTIIILALIIVFMKREEIYQENSKLPDLISKFFFFHINTLSSPIILTLTRIIQNFQGNIKINSLNTELEDLKILIIVAVIFAYLVGFLLSLICFQPSIVAGKFSRRFGFTDFNIHLAKTSLTIGLLFSSNGGFNSVLEIFIPILSSLANIYIGIFISPYYSIDASEQITKFSGFNSGMGICTLIFYFSETGIIISEVLLFSFVGGVVLMCIRYIERSLFNLKNEKLFESKTEREAYSKLAILLKILSTDLGNLKDTNGIYSVMYRGIIHQHHRVCDDKICYCRFFNQHEELFYFTASELEILKEEFKLKLIKALVEPVFKKNINCCWLKFNFAEIILNHKIEMYTLALSILNSIKLMKADSISKTLVSNMKIRIASHANRFMHDQSEFVDMFKYTDYKSSISFFKQKIIEVIKLTKIFWSEYKHMDPSASKLYSKSQQINKLDDFIRDKWKFMKENFSIVLLDDYVYYAAYSLVIRNSTAYCFSILKYFDLQRSHIVQSQFESEEITSLTINQSQNIAISLDMNLDTLGRVLNCYGKAQHIIGWKASELKGQRIETIIPPYVRDFHRSFLRRHVTSGRITLLYTNRLVYGQHKNGYIVPLKVRITPSTHLDEGFSYLGIVRPLKATEDCLIINHEGKILSCTEKIGTALKISSESGESSNVSEFCSNFILVNKLFNTGSFITQNRKLIQDSLDPEDLNYLKGKKLLLSFTQNQPEISDNMLFPKCEEEFNNVLKIYNKIKHDGWPLEFILKNGEIQKFNCKMKEDQNFHKENIKYLLMRAIGPKKIGEKEANSNTFSLASQYLTKLLIDNSQKNKKSIPQVAIKIEESRYINQKNITDLGIKDISATIDGSIVNEKNNRDDEIEFATRMFEECQKIGKNMEEISISNYFDFKKNRIEETLEEQYLDLIYSRKKKSAKLPGEESSLNSGLSINGRITITEKALRNPVKDDLLYMIVALLGIFLLAGILLFFIFNFTVTKTNSKSFFTSKLLDNSLETLSHLLLLHFDTQFMFFSQNNLIPNRPISHEIEQEYLKRTESNMKELEILSFRWLEDLQYSNQLSLSKFILSTKMKLRDSDEFYYYNLKEAITDIRYSALKITKEGFNMSTLEVQNIIENIPNDISINLEKQTQFIYEDLTNEIGATQLFLNSILIGTGLAAFFVVAIYAYREIKFATKKTHYMDGFIRMNVKDMEHYLTRTEKFEEVYKDMLEIEHKEDANYQVRVKQKSKLASAKNNQKIYQVKRLNTKSFYITSILRFGAGFWTVFSIFLGIIIVKNVLHTVDDKFVLFNNALLTNYQILNGFISYITLAYRYIGTKKRGLYYNLPASEAIKSQTEFVKSNSLYESLFNSPEIVLENMQQIYRENLCSVLFQTTGDINVCETSYNNAIRFGVVGINQFIITTIDNAITTYNTMVENDDSVRYVLNSKNLRDLEHFLFDVYGEPFDLIQHRLLDQIANYHDQYAHILWSSNALIFGMSLFLVLSSLKWIYRNADEENYYLQRMLQMMPLESIMENAHLKPYLPKLK